VEIVGVLAEQVGHSLDDSRVQYGVAFIHRFDDADQSQNVVDRLLEQIGLALDPRFASGRRPGPGRRLLT